MNGINFFTPLRYEGIPNSCETLTGIVDNYFCLGDRVVAVIDKTNQNEIDFIQERASCLGTALKIITYMTIIIPLIMLAAKLMLRYCCCWCAPTNGPIRQPPPPPPFFIPIPQPLPPRVTPLPPPQFFNPTPQPLPPRVTPLPPPQLFNPTPQPLPPRVIAPLPRQSLTPEQKKLKIEQKLCRTFEAYADFIRDRDQQLPAKQDDPAWVVLAEEVDDFYVTIIKQFDTGVNAPIPVYYHASRDAVDEIALQNILRQSRDGAAGPGVYISTGDEHYNGYGDNTYVLDPDAVEHLLAIYFNPFAPNRLGEETGVWIAVQSDIVVSGENVAYIAVPDQQKKKEFIQKYWQGNNNRGIEFYAPILTRAASDWIRKSYRAVYRIPLPSQWRRRDNYGTMPQHIIEHTG